MSGDGEMGRAFARGVIAAMAMSGLRKVTKGLGLVERTPPKRVALEGTPALVRGISPERRDVAVELAHWTFGGVGGAAFGLLPRLVRAQVWAGPVYGVGVWLGYELVLAPILGLQRRNKPSVGERAALIADHVLYGVVVASSPWPHEPR
jgi:hypothetical protein